MSTSVMPTLYPRPAPAAYRARQCPDWPGRRAGIGCRKIFPVPGLLAPGKQLFNSVRSRFMRLARILRKFARKDPGLSPKGRAVLPVMAGGNEIFKNCAGGFGFLGALSSSRRLTMRAWGKNMPEGLARIQVVIQDSSNRAGNVDHSSRISLGSAVFFQDARPSALSASSRAE